MSKKALVLVDLVDSISDKEYHVWAYRHSVVASHFKSLGYKLFHSDSLCDDDLKDFTLDESPDFNKYDEIIVTMNTSSYWLKELASKEVKYIYEDGDAYEYLVKTAINDENCKLVVVPSIKSVNIDSDKLIEIDFIYDSSLESEISDHKFNISLFANNYYQDRRNKLVRSGLLIDTTFLLSGKGWDDLGGRHNYIGAQDLMKSEETSYLSIIDISEKYLQYDILPRKLVELLYKGMIPVVPRMERTIRIFGENYPFMYDSELDWSKFSINEDHYKLLINKLRSQFKANYSLPSNMLS